MTFVIVTLGALITTYLSQRSQIGGADPGKLLGELFLQNGIGLIIVSSWQIISSSEIAKRKQKWLGFVLSVAMAILGAFFLIFFAKDRAPFHAITSGLLLSMVAGPLFATILLLDPKEKETLALPYLDNFVSFVADVLDTEYHASFHILVPSIKAYAACAAINDRTKQYKDLHCLAELSLQARAGPRKFAVTFRQAGPDTYYFDIPSVLQGATPSKLELFKTALRARLVDIQKKDRRLLNVIIKEIDNLTLAEFDRAFTESVKSPNFADVSCNSCAML